MVFHAASSQKKNYFLMNYVLCENNMFYELCENNSDLSKILETLQTHGILQKHFRLPPTIIYSSKTPWNPSKSLGYLQIPRCLQNPESLQKPRTPPKTLGPLLSTQSL